MTIALLYGLLACSSVAQSSVDRVGGVSPTERLNSDWKAFENRPVNANGNQPSYACIDGTVMSEGPLGVPLSGASIDLFEDDVASARETTRSDGAIRLCINPRSKQARVEIRHASFSPRTITWPAAAPPRRLDVVLTR